METGFLETGFVSYSRIIACVNFQWEIYGRFRMLAWWLENLLRDSDWHIKNLIAMVDRVTVKTITDLADSQNYGSVLDISAYDQVC